MGDWDIFDVEYRYDDQVRDEVLALAGRARVISPESLAADVRSHAQAALAAASASLEGDGRG